jgi:hypothetical protein
MRCCAAMQPAQLQLWPAHELWPAANKGRRPRPSKPRKPAPINQLRLPTEPGADRVASTDEELTSKREHLEQLLFDTRGNMETDENRLCGGSFRRGKGGFNGTLVRPPWAVGWTDAEIRQIAEARGANPYVDGWWARLNLVPGTGEMRDVGQSGLRGTGPKRGTAAEARRRLAASHAELGLILDAIEQLDDAGPDVVFYQTPWQPAEPLPWAEFIDPYPSTAPAPATVEPDEVAAEVEVNTAATDASIVEPIPLATKRRTYGTRYIRSRRRYTRDPAYVVASRAPAPTRVPRLPNVLPGPPGLEHRPRPQPPWPSWSGRPLAAPNLARGIYRP